MKGKKVGITGAAGVIGTILRQGLADACDLVLFDRHRIDVAAGQRSVVLDCAEPGQVAGAFAGLHALIHLAGDPRPNAPRSSTLRNNFLATSLVFEEARRAGVAKVVFASSNFYHQGDIGRLLRGETAEPITLDRNPTPLCLYGESKVFGEQVGRHLSLLGVRFVALRIGWAVPEDDPAPYGGAYMQAVYCSHRDLVSAFARALAVEEAFLAAFAVSANSQGVFDLTETRERLGSSPQDDAARHRRFRGPIR
ncbi:MAG: NAD(P)-dependent oxidoreductase [Thermodesulfobacteriota bacterium]